MDIEKMTLTEAQEALDALRFRATRMFNEAGPHLDWSQVKSEDGAPADKAKLWQTLQMQMSDLGKHVSDQKLIQEQMKTAAAAYQQSQTPVNAPPYMAESKGQQFIGEGFIRRAFLADAGYKRLQQEGEGAHGFNIQLKLSPAEYKTLITLSTVAPFNERGPLVNMRLEERTVIDAIGETQVGTTTVEWYEETTLTNAAAETAEDTAKPEGALDWTLRTSSVKTIAVWIPVTKQSLADVDFLEGQIRSRLAFMVSRREETQVLVGNGVGENITGIINTSGIQTQAKGADATPTAIMRAMGKVRGSAGSGFAEPDLIVLHPNDYIEIMSLQDTTGNYILQAVLQNEPQPRLWGLPIRQTTALTEGTGLVGAFGLGAEVFRREGISVTLTDGYSDYFVKNKVVVLAESRIGLAVQIPTAFCTVTSI